MLALGFLAGVATLHPAAAPPAFAATVRHSALEALDKALSDAVERANANPNRETQVATARAAEALIAAAEKAPPGPETAAYLARGLVERADCARDDGDLDITLAAASRAYALIKPYRDVAPDAYVQAIALAADVEMSRAFYRKAAERLGEGARYLEDRRGKLPATAALDMAESNIAYVLALAHLQLGEYDDAVLAQQAGVAARVRAVGEFHPSTISARYNLALRMVRAGRSEEAEALARLAVEQVTVHVPQADLGHVRAVEALALVLAAVGKRSEAVEVARHALEIRVATTGSQDANFASGLSSLGGLLTDLGRYAEAEPVLLKAFATFDALGERANQQDRLRVLTFLGQARLGLGKLEQARETLDQAFVIWNRSKAGGAAETLLPAVALARLDSGDAAGAAAAAQAHLAAASGPRAPVLGRAQACAMAALTGGDAAGCGAQPGADLVRAVADRLDASADGELILADRLSLELAMRLALQRTDMQLALDASQMLVGSKVARATRLAADRAGASDQALAQRIRALQDAEQAYRRANSVYLLLLGNGGDWQEARTTRDAALAALDRERADLARTHPSWAALAVRQGVTMAALQAALAPDAAELAVVPALSASFVLFMTPDAAVIQRMKPARAAFAGTAAQLRRALDRGAFDPVAAHDLYRAIFADLPAPALHKASALRIVTGDDAAAIPFAALLERPVDRIDGRAPFLVRRHALSIGATLLPAPDQGRKSVAQGTMLALGAPTSFGADRMADAAGSAKDSPVPRTVLASTVFRGGKADAASLAALPALQSAEVAMVARSVRQATVLTGPLANEDAFRAAPLDQYRVLLFATHALVAGEMEGIAEPALVLARPAAGARHDGVLTASEIGTLRLDADWVILSACNTAAGEGEAAPAYSGLAQAFRYAGARTLMLSHWPVRDDAAAAITGTVLREAAGGRSPAQALRRAMLRAMADSRLPDAANPHVWAPFVVFE
ncbi:MAG: CHAT domain-containing protein [Novosphingobium sp.]|nr:CHAT domain-containing protein [Novosphingobium sp.]